MTTVEQLIKHLQTLPQEAIVQVRNENGEYIYLNLDNHFYLFDFRDNKFVEESSPLFNKVLLELGE